MRDRVWAPAWSDAANVFVAGGVLSVGNRRGWLLLSLAFPTVADSGSAEDGPGRRDRSH